jgi:hypothetical protein
LETTSPEAAVTDAVPALQDRDTHVAQGGTPQDDPGDHRGQPWATSPGVPGLEEDSAEPEVQEPQPTLDTGQGVEGFDDEDETPRRPADQAGVEDSWGHDGEAAQPTGAEAVSTSQPTDEASEESPQPTEDASDESREPTGDASDAPPEPTGDASDAPPEPTGQNDESASQPSAEAGAETRQERRISSFEEVADGGFGIGSAAPIADGAQPLGHAVKGTHEGKSFLAPGEAGYDDVEPDVWFFNEEAARRAGFDRKAD